MTGPSHTSEVKVFEFTEKELSQLDIRKVRGADNNTVYTVGSNENGGYFKAVADAKIILEGKRDFVQTVLSMPLF